MPLRIDTVCAAIQAVPAVIAIVQGNDGTTKALAGSLIAIAGWLGLRHEIGFIHDATSSTLYQILAVAGAALGIVLAVRLKERIAGTLIVTGGALLAAHALGLLGE
jgi:hypothetical protein